MDRIFGQKGKPQLASFKITEFSLNRPIEPKRKFNLNKTSYAQNATSVWFKWVWSMRNGP